MEWEYQIKIRIFNWALLRKKDKYFKAGDARWRFAKRIDKCWRCL